jgi:hypothetical protein
MMRKGEKRVEFRASPVMANVPTEPNVSAEANVSAETPSHPLVGHSDVSAETSVTTHERFR